MPGHSNLSVSVIIPAFNEEDRVGETVRAAALIPHVGEVIVVDDGSTDRTSEEAAGAGARVSRLPSNRGKGGALTHGMNLASGDVLLLLDADLGASARQAENLLLPVLAGNCDLAIAIFPRRRGRAGFGLARGLARWGIQACTGLQMVEPLSGQRALKREVWEQIRQLDERFGVEVGFTIDAARLGFRITEVPAEMDHAATGRDLAGFLHRGRQLWDIARSLRFRLEVSPGENQNPGRDVTEKEEKPVLQGSRGKR